jgi:ubiquinone/menaquinone biosynthesis C-methylase UbiE
MEAYSLMTAARAGLGGAPLVVLEVGAGHGKLAYLVVEAP